MKLSLLKFAGAALAASALAAISSAASINGRIDFTGGLQLDSAPQLSTMIASVGSVTVANIGFIPSPSGDYAGTQGTIVAMKPFTYFPVLSPNPVIDLWKFDYLGKTYSFDLTSLTTVSRSSIGVTVSGLGMAHITGFTSTLGTFSFSTQTAVANRFSFSATSQVPPPGVPDSGTTVALLGGALVAMGLISRRRV